MGCNVTFKWDWSGTLAEDEWFAVRVGAEVPHSVTWVKEHSYIHVLKKSGEYVWEISICRGDPASHYCSGDAELAVSEQNEFSANGCNSGSSGSGGETPPP